MGTDYEAITVIGLRVTRAQLEKQRVEQVEEMCKCCGQSCTITRTINEWRDEISYVYDEDKEEKELLMFKRYYIDQPVYEENWWYIAIIINNRNGPRNYDSDETIKTDCTLEDLVN